MLYVSEYCMCIYIHVYIYVSTIWVYVATCLYIRATFFNIFCPVWRALSYTGVQIQTEKQSAPQSPAGQSHP